MLATNQPRLAEPEERPARERIVTEAEALAERIRGAISSGVPCRYCGAAGWTGAQIAAAAFGDVKRLLDRTELVRVGERVDLVIATNWVRGYCSSGCRHGHVYESVTALFEGVECADARALAAMRALAGSCARDRGARSVVWRAPQFADTIQHVAAMVNEKRGTSTRNLPLPLWRYPLIEDGVNLDEPKTLNGPRWHREATSIVSTIDRMGLWSEIPERATFFRRDRPNWPAVDDLSREAQYLIELAIECARLSRARLETVRASLASFAAGIAAGPVFLRDFVPSDDIGASMLVTALGPRTVTK